MTTLAFDVVEIVADRFAEAPQLRARVRATETSGVAVHAMAIRAQVMIEPQRRQYDGTEAAGLLDQFGERARWRDTVKPFLWTFASALVPGFTGATEFDLPIPATYDFEVTASKYLHALDDGVVPLRFLYSGTVFSRGGPGFAVEQIAWNLESPYRLPVSVWTELMDHFYPNAGWLRMNRETIAALVRFKGAHGLTTWDEVFARLLAGQALTL
jgi:hypothetical protein